MQPAPFRLQQAIRTAFRAARPARQSVCTPHWQQPFTPSRLKCSPVAYSRRDLCQPWGSSFSSQIRSYSNDKKQDIEEKIEDAKQRIDDSLDARSENPIHLPGPEQDTLKREETIIHTKPESSSIVYNPDSPGETAARGTATSTTTSASTDTSSSESSMTTDSHGQPRNGFNSTSASSASRSTTPLPSQLAARYSYLRERFTDFMDNFQTHIFTASKRLNDLTGYSSIEQLKSDIEAQEHNVRAARNAVRKSREDYQSTIAMRSDTQREVNDLLHRKHAWSPNDLERFTNLYRSDHANEQAEQNAQNKLGQIEKEYEEASTRLSKSILARYHEEQVWSDKIRQMSTWGTWGLMGLNVLLFVVFQILIEPWRRRRLVRGFEDKVQEALREQTAESELRTIFHVNRAQEEVAALSRRNLVEGSESTAAAAAVGADSVKGVQATQEQNNAETRELVQADITLEDPSLTEMAERTNIEQTAEAITTAQALSDTQGQKAAIATSDTPSIQSASIDTYTATIEDPAQSTLDTDTQPLPSTTKDLPSISSAEYKDLPFLLGSYTRRYFDVATSKLESLFDEKTEVVMTRRDFTARILEGAFMGGVGVVCFFWAVGISSVRGR